MRSDSAIHAMRQGGVFSKPIPLNFGEFLLLAHHGVFLRAQLFRNHGDVAIAQEIGNLWQWHIERA